MKSLKVAVVGLGYWGPNIVRNLLKIPQIEIELACDISKEKLKIFSKSFPFINTTQDFNEILKSPSVQAVIIATPIDSHFILAKQSLMVNKHIFIEKPMTQTSKQAKELIKIAKKKKKIIMVGHTFVYTEAVKKIKKLMSQNMLGKIYYYDSTRINLGLLQKDTNVIWDLAVHDLAIITHLFLEQPTMIQAFGSGFINKNNEEIAHVFISYKNNIIAHINVSWLSPVKIRSIFIAGEKKMILYNDIEPTEKIKIYDKNITLSPFQITPFSPAYRSGDVLIPQINQQEALYNEFLHFVDCVSNNKKPITDGQEGLKVVLLLELINKALKKKSIIKINEKK